MEQSVVLRNTVARGLEKNGKELGAGWVPWAPPGVQEART